MFPSAGGVSVSMSLGDTIYETQNFTFDPSWNFINCIFVVFIQNDSNREVQQAAKWCIPVDVPNLTNTGHSIDDSSGDNDKRADPGETVDMIVPLYNDPLFLEATNVTVTISTDDPDVNIISATSSYPDIPPDSTKDNSSNPFSFSVSSPSYVHRAKFIMEISAQPNDYIRTDTLLVMIGRPDVIFVDNDGGNAYGNVEDYFYTAADGFGIIYDIASDSAIEMQFIDEYSAVVWFTGSLDTNTIPDTSQTMLANYLDGGGQLFITGQDIGHDIGGTAFYTNYLHSIFKTDDVNYFGILGVSGDPIGDGLVLVISGPGGANNQSSPSAVSKTSDADSAFTYPGTIGPCAVRFSGDYKMIYFSFGFEAINSEEKRIEVITRIFEWFELVQGIEENPVVQNPVNSVIRISPNPFRNKVNIEFSIPRSMKSLKAEVYDLSGRLVKDFSLGTSQSSTFAEVLWDGKDMMGRDLPSGIYFLNVKSGNQLIKREKLIMLR